MRKLAMSLFAPALLLVAACGRSEKKLDEALSNDLALASSVQPYQPQQFVSPYEQQYGQQPYYGQYQPQTYGQYSQYPVRAPQRVVQRAPMPVRRTSSAGRVVTRSEPIRHTKRDAAIGAAAGAVLGAATSRDRVKGGLIGAAAGAVLGGIVGHTVDVEKP